MPTFKENTPDHELRRQTRGLAIASIYSSVRRINKLQYKVKSRSDAWKWYDVTTYRCHKIPGLEVLVEHAEKKEVYILSISMSLIRSSRSSCHHFLFFLISPP